MAITKDIKNNSAKINWPFEKTASIILFKFIFKSLKIKKSFLHKYKKLSQNLEKAVLLFFQGAGRK